MTTVIVQIPCYNEERALPSTLADVPRVIDGVDRVEVLVVDDGSTDRTVQMAERAGVDHIVRHSTNRGLARAFQTGLEAALRLGADIVVNTDADNQYAGRDIPALIRPILDGRADLVVGDRRPGELQHFSRGKRLLQRLGSWVVRRLSGLEVPDAVSGFRAMSRDAILETTIVGSFSYTTEQLIQAGNKGLAVVSVPVAVNPDTRPSRLITSLPRFILATAATMARTYTLYKPLRIYSGFGLVLSVIGLAPIVRFLYYFVTESGQGHVQSLVLGGALLTIGFITFLFGILAELVSSNRKLLETTIEAVRRLELSRRDER